MKLSRLALAVSLLPGSLLAAESGDSADLYQIPSLVITSGRQPEPR